MFHLTYKLFLWRLLLVWFVFTLSIPSISHAAVAVQSVTAFLNSPSDTSHTESVTVSSGSNLVMAFPVMSESETVTVTAAYGGVGVTVHSSHSCTPTSTIRWFYLINPVVGTADLVLTASASAVFYGGVYVFTGVDQTTPLGTPIYNGSGASCGTGANPSITISSATDDIVIDGLMESAGAATVGAGQTDRWNNGCPNIYCGHGSTEPGASSVTMSWTVSAFDRHYSAVNVLQVSGAGPTPFLFWQD